MELDKHELREIIESLLNASLKEVKVDFTIGENQTILTVNKNQHIEIEGYSGYSPMYLQYSELENRFSIDFKGDVNVNFIEVDGVQITPDIVTCELEWYLNVLAHVAKDHTRCNITVIHNKAFANLDILANGAVYRKYKSPDGKQIMLFKNSIAQVLEKFQSYNVVTHNVMEDNLDEHAYLQIQRTTSKSVAKLFKFVDCIKEEAQVR